jgi:hypothetical protein
VNELVRVSVCWSQEEPCQVGLEGRQDGYSWMQLDLAPSSGEHSLVAYLNILSATTHQSSGKECIGHTLGFPSKERRKNLKYKCTGNSQIHRLE